MPVVIDDLTLEDAKNGNAFKFREIGKLLQSDNDMFSINKNAEDVFFIYGHFQIANKTALILFEKEQNHAAELFRCYFMILNDNHKLESFREIAWFGKNIISKSAVIYADKIFEFFKSNNNGEKSINFLRLYDQALKKDFFPFVEYNCPEISECVQFKTNKDSLPNRKFEYLSFDKLFFENETNLIPIKYGSTDTNTQVLSSIDFEKKLDVNSFFIESNDIEINGFKGKIVFFLNRYRYENYKNVQEVGYQIFNEQNILLKKDQIAQYYVHKKGTTFLSKAKVFIKDKQLIIEICNDLNKTEITKFNLYSN